MKGGGNMATELFKLMGKITIEMDDALNDLGKIEGLLETVIGALNRLDNTLNTTNGSLNAIKGNLSAVASELGTLDGKANAADGELDSLSGTANTLESRMESVESAINKVSQELIELDAKASTAGTELGQLDTKLNGLGNLFSVDGALGTGAVWLGNVLEDLTYKALDLGWDFMKIGINFNASVETYKASLKTMLGLTEKETEAVYEKLYSFAKETPYSMEGVMDSAVKLFNSGMGIDDTMRTLSVLGDLAGGNSEKLTRLIKAYTDTKGYGFLRAQERNQFVENEVLLYGLLSDYYAAVGKGQFTADELAVMQSKKEISDEDVWSALEFATSEEGRYYNYMAALMETWRGRVEKSGDTLNETAGAFTLPIFETLKDETLPQATALLEEFKTWATNNEASIKEVAEAISAIAIDGLDSLSTLLQFYIDNKNVIIPAFTAIATALGTVFAASHPLIATFAAINAGILALIENKDKLDDWLANTTLGGAIGVTQKEVELREHTQGYLNMKASDYETEDDYNAARLAKLGAIEDAYTALVMRVSGTEDQKELEKQLGMGISEYLSAVRTDLDMLYKSGTTNDNLQLLNSLIPLWAGYNMAVSKEFLGASAAYHESPYTIGEDGKLYLTNPDAAEKEAKLAAMEEELRTNTHMFGFGYSDVDLGGAENSAGSAGLISALLQQLSTLKTDVEAAAKAGVEAGVSQIGINAHVTTGQVVLDSGAVVGELTPRINMSLGNFYEVSYNDD